MKNEKNKVNSPYTKPCDKGLKNKMNNQELQKMHEVIATEAAQESSIAEENQKTN